MNEFNNENNFRTEENAQPAGTELHTETTPTGRTKKSGNRKGLKTAALVLSCAILGGAAGLGGSYLGNSLQSTGNTSTASVQTSVESTKTAAVQTGTLTSSGLNVAQTSTGTTLTAAEVYEANVNSTVGITTETTTNLFGYQTVSAASGSGFIITADGYILTNYHVIEDSDTITVSLYDGTTYDAELIGYDESNDIAVLKVDAEDLTPVVIGDSDALSVGDSVIAIGNPLGELTFSLTAGVVSALNREVTLSSNMTMNLIQTDCAINSGNSGGALFNMRGEVIGITNAKYSSSGSMSEASVDNIGFAIPINSVISSVESIIENGYVSKPYIGVSVSDVSDELLNYGIPEGAEVASVTEDSPAEDAGLQANDIITAVNGTEITGKSELSSLVSASTPGDVLTLTVYRSGETIEVEVTVGENVQSALADEEEDESDASEEMGGQSQQDSMGSPWSFGYSYGY